MSVSFVPTDGSTPLPLLVNGEPEKVDEARASEIIAAEDLEIRVELGLGSEAAKYWTCDFSYVSCCHTYGDLVVILTFAFAMQEYVRINGDYRT